MQTISSKTANDTRYFFFIVFYMYDYCYETSFNLFFCLFVVDYLSCPTIIENYCVSFYGNKDRDI